MSTKIKTLHVMELLLELTDEEHTLTATDIVEMLERRYGYKPDRKSIYADLQVLEDFGLEIVQNKGTNPGYYVGSRDFELPELKLLVDAVQSSKFITKKKSDELIKKLEKLTNKYSAEHLQRSVYIYNRVKTDNEKIYYSVDDIHNAINHNHQIKFKYVQWTPDGKLVYRHDGDYYIESPWALTWDDENYYLLAYEESSDKIKYFRVDKIRDLEVIETPRMGDALFKDFDLAEFSKRTFGMFQGKGERVTLECANALAGVMIDRFGQKIMMRKSGDNHFRCSVNVELGPHFYGWLTGVGKDVKIVEPKEAADEYRQYLEDILNG